MLDHIFLTVSDLNRSIAFYEAVLPVVGIVARHDYDGRQGPPAHPDLKGFGAGGRVFFWLRQGTPAPQAVHVGFVAHSEAEVRAVHSAALAAGAKEIHHLALSCTMIPDTMPRSCKTLMGTAWSSFSRAGSMPTDYPRGRAGRYNPAALDMLTRKRLRSRR